MHEVRIYIQYFSGVVRIISFKTPSTVYPSPNTGCFFTLVTAFNVRKSAPKKLIFFFQDKFYSLKVHAHYFTVIIYLITWRAGKLGIFTHFMFTNLPWCSQSIDSLVCVYYVYSILSTDPQLLFECLITVMIAFLHTTTAPPPPQKKKIMYYPLTSTIVYRKKIKSSRKEYVMWACFEFWPIKNIFRKLWANESLIMACLQIHRELLSVATFLRGSFKLKRGIVTLLTKYIL